LSFDHDPELCLKDILFNVSRIERYMAGVSREGFARNDLVVDAVEHCLQRICEAVYRLGERATQLLANQPSAQIRALGNRFRHAYDAIDLAAIGRQRQTIRNYVADSPLRVVNGLAADAIWQHQNIVRFHRVLQLTGDPMQREPISDRIVNAIRHAVRIRQRTRNASSAGRGSGRRFRGYQGGQRSRRIPN
jgi:uncharacterized protein with HEPN domain